MPPFVRLSCSHSDFFFVFRVVSQVCTYLKEYKQRMPSVTELAAEIARLREIVRNDIQCAHSPGGKRVFASPGPPSKRLTEPPKRWAHVHSDPQKDKLPKARISMSVHRLHDISVKSKKDFEESRVILMNTRLTTPKIFTPDDIHNSCSRLATPVYDTHILSHKLKVLSRREKLTAKETKASGSRLCNTELANRKTLAQILMNKYVHVYDV